MPQCPIPGDATACIFPLRIYTKGYRMHMIVFYLQNIIYPIDTYRIRMVECWPR